MSLTLHQAGTLKAVDHQPLGTLLISQIRQPHAKVMTAHPMPELSLHHTGSAPPVTGRLQPIQAIASQPRPFVAFVHPRMRPDHRCGPLPIPLLRHHRHQQRRKSRITRQHVRRAEKLTLSQFGETAMQQLGEQPRRQSNGQRPFTDTRPAINAVMRRKPQSISELRRQG
ncbi:hypothetical protein Ari01nite_69400 [Paractinoplanes rishiriensis]|uniref:Uncharacterized protein n=1 Tax=Paractinoplanes rishiriensis TaxID=1050105 RepID=A0A919K5U2_9ACTN|nr:hypothetical protein Ari01nite_69400 [Actinoplanes rishiriensis]